MSKDPVSPPRSNEVDKMLAQTNREMEESKKLLQTLANDVAALADVVQPALEKQIAALRSARMTTVSEIQQSLVALRDVRKFFLEDAYGVEMDRLERFTSMCERLRSLKTDGTLDAVADSMLKLAAVSNA